MPAIQTILFFFYFDRSALLKLLTPFFILPSVLTYFLSNVCVEYFRDQSFEVYNQTYHFLLRFKNETDKSDDNNAQKR